LSQSWCAKRLDERNPIGPFVRDTENDRLAACIVKRLTNQRFAGCRKADGRTALGGNGWQALALRFSLG